MSFNKTKLILIDSNLKDTDVLLASLNTLTYGLLYNYYTSRNAILQQIESEFGNGSIERVAICCHEDVTSFLENEDFFDISDNLISPNDNTRFVIDLLTNKNVSNLDYLACNSLKHQEWKDYYNLIENAVKCVTVGASSDATGNLKYGGNWFMENTGENIDDIYFSENVKYYNYLFSASKFLVLGNSAQDNLFRRTLLDSFQSNTHVEVHTDITTMDHNAGTNNYLVSMVIPDTVTIMRHHTWHSNINNLTYIVFKQFNETITAPQLIGSQDQIDHPKTNILIFPTSSTSNIFIGKYRMVGSREEINAAFKEYIVGDLSHNSTYLVESKISIIVFSISQITYNSLSTTGIIKIQFSRPGMLQDEIEDFLTVNSNIGNITNLISNDGITWTGTFTPNETYNLSCYIEFNYYRYDTSLNKTSNEFSVTTLLKLDLFTITQDITVENPGAINMTFSNNGLTATDISNSLTIDPTDAGTITNISDSGTNWTATLVPNYGLNLTDCSLNFDHTDHGINQTIHFNVETYIQEIKSITLTPDNIITDLSSNLEVVLRVPSDIEPTISIDPSYISYLDGSMTSIDNGLTWNGAINRTLDMNLLGNTLTVNIGDASGQIEFDVLEKDSLLVPISVTLGKIFNIRDDNVYGNSVSISGDGNRIAITSLNLMKVYEYRDTWVQIGDSKSGERGKCTLSEDGTTIAFSLNNTHAQIYKYLDISNIWVPLGDLVGTINSDGNSNTTLSLSRDGKIVALSGNLITNIYEYLSDTWTIMKGDISGGYTVSLSDDGTRVAIGNPGYGVGFVKIYNYYQTTWTLMETIDTTNNGGQSVSLSADGTRVAIGCPNYGNKGLVKIYEWDLSNWVPLGGDISGGNTNDHYGRSVAISSNGSRVAIGAPLSDVGQIYEWNSTEWVPIGGNINGENASGQFGHSISLSRDGTRVVVGSNNESKNILNYAQIIDIDSTHISRQLTSITLDSSNIIYPDLSTNFQINFTTNDALLNDISGNLNLTSTVSNINTSSLSLSNYGFRLEGNIVADEYKSDNINNLSYYETNDISGESVNYNINTNPTFELIECTLTPSNLVGTDVSGVLRIEFNTPLPATTNLNNYITLDPSYIATLETIIDVSNGFIWEGVLERSQNMNKLGNKLDFDYSYNGVEVSANLVFDVLESNDLLFRNPNHSQIGSFDITSSTKVSISSDGNTLAIGDSSNDQNGTDYGIVSIYSYDEASSNWIPLGDSIYGNEENYYVGKSIFLSGNGNVVAFMSKSNTKNKINVYQFNGSEWIQFGNIIEGNNTPSTTYSLSLSSDGTVLAAGTSRANFYSGVVNIYIIDSSLPEPSWSPLGSELSSDSPPESYSFGESVSLSQDGYVVAIGSTGDGVHLYYYNDEWVKNGHIDSLVNTPSFGLSVSLSSNGKIVAVGSSEHEHDNGETNTGQVFVYGLNETETTWDNLGNDIINTTHHKFGYRVSLSSDGSIVAVATQYGNINAGFVGLYKLLNDVWEPKQDINNIGSYFGKQLALSGDGNRVAVANTTNMIVYEYENQLKHESSLITLDSSNIEFPDLSTNFQINLTTNDVTLEEIKTNASTLLTIDPSYVGNIDANSLTLSNHGFLLEGQFDVSGEHDAKNVQLYYKDFSSNMFDIYSIEDLTINEFQYNSSLVTYENYETNKITLTLNRSDLTNVDISNSLTVVPSSCGQIIDVSGKGTIREISFEPTLFIDEPDCSLTFHYTNAQLDASMTIPFSVETLQGIEDISMNPRSILGTNNSSTLGVKFRIPIESSGTTPDITITPSYVALMQDSMVLDGDLWTGYIKNNTTYMNLLYNTIDFSYNGFDTSLNFNVAKNPELIVGPREIGDFVDCSGIKISSTSLTEAFTIYEVELFDDIGLILTGTYEKSNGLDAAAIMNGDMNDSSTVPATTIPTEKWFKINFGSNKKIKEITIHASHSVNIELFGPGSAYQTIANLGTLLIDTSGTLNIATAAANSTIIRNIQSISLDPSNIALGVNSANIEVLFSTNDVSKNAIVDSKYLTIDPSNIGSITNQKLALDGFKLTGIFEPNEGFNTSNNKLNYFENEDISGVHIFSLDSVKLKITDVSISQEITYLDNSGVLNVKFTREVNDFTESHIVVDNSVSISNVSKVDSGFNWKATLTFPYTETDISVNYEIDVSFNSDVSFNLTKTCNTYVPQISNIVDENLFDYIDTSGTILLEFDKAMLRVMELSDLSYNKTKLNLSLEKLTDSSYNILVDPSGEYTETQVITIKDFLGVDLSNVTLYIDTVIPSISEIILNPNMLTYGATEGILDVKFNKNLLDRGQLVLTSSSNIGYSFKQQLDQNTPIIVVTEVNNPHDPPLVNFTYTIEGVASENIVKSALQKWDNIIKKHPLDVNNVANSGTTKIHITFNVSEMDAGTLGYANVDYVYYDDLNHNGQIDYSDNIYTSSGFIALSQSSYNSMISETRSDGNTTLYYVLMHEIGHIIGIGPYFGHNNSPRVAYEENGITKYYYTGVNALAKYRMYMNDDALVGIPIEDDGGAGTANVHPEEHRIEGHTRHIGGHPHQGLDEELMTGWTESGSTIMPLSAVSIGFLEDMGYEVDYSYADEYKGINIDTNGDKILGSSLSSGSNMKSTSYQYSVVQYDVSVNYGIKNTEDISFNYRGDHDMSNIDIDVNTIIPDVSSILIENILYTDNSGIVTITFNNHNGNYFEGKDASMNIYLDPSLNGDISLNMDIITGNEWKGVITCIKDQFYPQAVLHLKHSNMDGLINIDVSNTYRLDTTERGLYITLPEMGPRNIGSSQTINYLTYDHFTNKLETDVSFQFNIYVGGDNRDPEQFPYTDICNNFIAISSSNLNNGDVALDTGSGYFVDRFWRGILTISGEIQGSFDISYNEELDPLRNDDVVEYRRDKLTVNVNTILPDISNIIVPSKLTYLDISGDVEVEFDKDVLDPENIIMTLSNSDVSFSTFSNIDNNNKKWKSQLTLMNSVNNILNISINYRDHTLETNISIFGVVPDVSSVTLSRTDLTYSDPSCVVIVEFNNALQDRANIYDLVNLEPSAHLFILNSSFQTDDNISWTGILDISNNQSNEFAYTDAKIAINGIQSDAFETGLSGEKLFDIDTILPDISNVSISNMGYSTKTSNFTITFTKYDLSGLNIYNSLSVSDNDLTINAELIQGNQLNGTITTGTADILSDVSFVIDYSFNYRNDSLTKQIYRDTIFEVDTRNRGVEIFDITNNIITNNGTQYLFHYLDRKAKMRLKFITNDLSGNNITNYLSFDKEIDYTLGNKEGVNTKTFISNITVKSNQNVGPLTFKYGDSEGREGTITDIYIDTRPRTIVDISFNKSRLTYLDTSGILTVTFNFNIFESADVIANKLNYSTADLSLNNAVIIENVWSCDLTSISELNGSIDVSMVYDSITYSLASSVTLDTIIPRIDTPNNTDISNKNITYNARTSLVKITFTNEIESDVDITSTLKLSSISDSLYTFHGELDTSKIEWNGQLTISDWDISLTDVNIYSTYEGGTIINNDNLKININTVRPKIDDISIDKNIFTYLEPSGTLSITFKGESVLDTSINSFISSGSAITVGNMSRSANKWTGTISINQHDISDNQNVNINYYDQNASINIPFTTILPRIVNISNIDNSINYLDLGINRELEFDFSGQIFEQNIDNYISINNTDCSLNTFSRINNNSFKANFVVKNEANIDNLKLDFSYNSAYYSTPVNQAFELMNVDTRIPNIKNTSVSNENLTYDVSSTQLDVYFDASLLDISASLVLDASLNTSFDLDSSINISPFEEISKRHYRANITTDYGIDNVIGKSVTVNYMDTSANIVFNVDTILRPYSNICFPKGERVLTDNGYKNIEVVQRFFDTIGGRKIEELTQTQTTDKTLVFIKKGAIMLGVPNKDTFVTNNHKVFFRGNLIEAYKLVNMVKTGVQFEKYSGEILYNILLEGDQENKMIVNGMIVETLSPSNNIASLYKKIRKYGTTPYKEKRMIELFNHNKK
jgi:hypothetical protein